MSFQEESAGSGYQTPMTELDDHRRQIPTVQRPERSRRSTFDSLYAHARLDTLSPDNLQPPPSRHAEQAILDDEGDCSPLSPRSRRPTVESLASVAPDRSLSPPNSVKAFAEARRRERGMSISADRDADAVSIGSFHSDLSRHSNQSRRSFKSKHPTVPDNDDASIASTAEEDVCFPAPDRKDSQYVDFEYLQMFIKTQADEEALAAIQREASRRSFPDLSQETRPQDMMVTADGDFVAGAAMDEKEAADSKSTPAQVQAPLAVTDHGRFNFFSSAWESTAHASSLGGLLFDTEDVRHLFTFPKEESDGVWWLNATNPSEEEVRALCKAFGVHPLTVEDVITQEAREKIELFPSYYFASFRSFMTVEEEHGVEYEPYNIYVIVFRQGTLSFSYHQNVHAAFVRQRIAMLKDYVSLSSDWICYALIDHIVDCFAPIINKLEREIDLIEDEVFVTRAEDMQPFLMKMGVARKQTLSLSRLLIGKADVLRGFTKRCNADYQVTPRMDIGLYLGDIQDHIITMHNNLQHFEKILTRTQSSYLGHLTVESIVSGTKANKGLSQITTLGTVIIPLTLLCGLFGMNVPVPFQDTESLIPFWTIFSIILGCMLLMILILKGRGRI